MIRLGRAALGLGWYTRLEERDGELVSTLHYNTGPDEDGFYDDDDDRDDGMIDDDDRDDDDDDF